MKKFIPLIFIALFLVTIVSAVPPQTFTGDTGFQIETPLRDAISFNKSHKFHFHVFNLTTGLPIETTEATCEFHLYDNAGGHQFKGQASFDAPYDFEIELSPFNFTRYGGYTYIIQCNNSNYGGFSEASFDVTPTGEATNTAQAIICVFLLLSIIFLSWLFAYLGFKFFDSDQTFHFGLFFVVVAMLLSVYALHFGFIMARDSLYIGSFAGSQYKMYIGIMWGLMAMSFMALLGLMWKTLREFRERKSNYQQSDGWNDPRRGKGFYSENSFESGGKK